MPRKERPGDRSPDPSSSRRRASREAPSAPAAASQGFPIVGLGASAGGLAAFESFFSAIPRDTQTGMAFVLVQHLAPDHKSVLTELIQRCTGMEVHQIEDGMRVEADAVYIIPPNLDLVLCDGVLHLLEPVAAPGARLPIDVFFRSLAQDQHERAICVVLSGSGSDGTLGARAVKGEGGMVMVQSPETAAYDGMPRSVLATGLTDFILPPEAMPAQLTAYVRHAFGKRRALTTPPVTIDDALPKVCVLLREKTGHDFSQYKQTTLVRRIERRMALHQIARQDEYVRYLQQDPGEAEALFRDLLIGVTSFFRDPEAFEALEREAIPRLFADKTSGATVRVWVCGCSTGEEAYSIAILLQEHLESLREVFKVQVFATDIDPQAIDQARAGVYPANIAADVSPERLARFFSREPQGNAYRIQKVIRDMLVFSEQDLIRDPPFSRLDLISCRNFLIYVNPELQKKLIALFHYALSPEGVLFLGTSETVGESLTLFGPLDRKWKLYLRQGDQERAAMPSIGELMAPVSAAAGRAFDKSLSERRGGRLDLRTLIERALLKHYDCAALLVNGRGEILHIHGRTGRYLEPAPGDAQLNVLGMAREGLRRALMTAFQQAVSRKEVARMSRLRVKTNGDHILVDLAVRPAQTADAGMPLADLYLVVLEPSVDPMAMPEADSGAEREPPSTGEGRDRRIAELELELGAKEEYLQTTLEEMETSNEELRSTNEELQSVNEELQSANEELETSKEELQSVNEELATVNAELQTKVADLSRANNDMNNLLAGTGVAMLFVDHQLRITRFTPATTQLIKLIQTDVGRPVGDIVSNLVDYSALVPDLKAVLETLIPQEREVMTQDGVWYRMRIGPYRTLENVIEGAVITFMDISESKRAETEMREARLLAESIVETAPVPILVLGEDLRAIYVNKAYYTAFGGTRSDTLGGSLDDISGGCWNAPGLEPRLRQVQTTGVGMVGYRLTQLLPGNRRRSVILNVDHLESRTGQTGHLMLICSEALESSDDPVE